MTNESTDLTLEERKRIVKVWAAISRMKQPPRPGVEFSRVTVQMFTEPADPNP